MAISTKTGRLILFIARIPPPITGQAVACEALYADLVRWGDDVTLVNLSKHSFRHGVDSNWHLLEIARILGKVLRHGRLSELVYLTSAESTAGTLKHLAIVLCLGLRIGRTYPHMHGDTTMRQILSDRHPWLHRMNALLLRKVAGVIVLCDRFVSMTKIGRMNARLAWAEYRRTRHIWIG